MTKRRKIFLLVGLLVSVPATGYAAMSVVFYAWLNAAEPERWPSDRAAIWVIGALITTLLFLSTFVYCTVSLIKEANRRYLKKNTENRAART